MLSAVFIFGYVSGIFFGFLIGNGGRDLRLFRRQR